MPHPFEARAHRFDIREHATNIMHTENPDNPPGSGSSNLRERIESALRTAEVNKSVDHAQVLRLLLCAIGDHDWASGSLARCDDGKITRIMHTMIRQRRDSMAQHDRTEAEILESFLPTPLNDEQMRMAAERIIEELGAHGLRDLGRCVREIKARFPGRVESGRVNDIVRQALIGGDRSAVASRLR